MSSWQPKIATAIGNIHVLFTFEQLCWWNFMNIASEITRRYSLTENSLIFCLLQSFYSSSLMFWACAADCFVYITTGPGFHIFVFWLAMVFHSVFCMFWREVGLMRGEQYKVLFPLFCEYLVSNLRAESCGLPSSYLTFSYSISSNLLDLGPSPFSYARRKYMSLAFVSIASFSLQNETHNFWWFVNVLFAYFLLMIIMGFNILILWRKIKMPSLNCRQLEDCFSR